MKTPACILSAALLIFAVPSAAPADDLQGADALLKELAAHNADVAAHPVTGGADTPGKLAADIAAYSKAAATLAPEDAASQWLAFVDRDMAIAHKNRSNGQPTYAQSQFPAMVAVLPPPADWPALAKAVDARPDKDLYQNIMLRLVAHRLVDDNAALNKDLEALGGAMQKATGIEDRGKSFVVMLKGELLADADNGAAILKQNEETLASAAGSSSPMQFQILDLVSLVGPDKAADFIKRALVANVTILRVDGDDTAKLTRKLALELVPKMKLPQWGVALSIDSTALFEAMQKRFSTHPAPEGVYGYPPARMYYIMGLIASHRTKDAAAAAKTAGSAGVPNGAINALERAGLVKDLSSFLHDLLADNPTLPYWPEYLEIAVKAGQQDKMLSLIEASRASPNLSDSQRLSLEGYLGRAYLAIDRMEDGVAVLRKQLAEVSKAAPDTKVKGVAMHAGLTYLTDVDIGALGTSLARLGGVLGRKDLVDDGVKAVIEDIHQKQDAGNVHDAMEQSQSLAGLLIELGRPEQAETVLKEALFSVPATEYRTRKAEDCMVALMAIYSRENRPADVLALLDQAPCWGGKDLSNVLTKSVTIDRNPDYAGYFAASALAATGRNADARKILDALLDQEPDYDPAYELLIKIAPRDEALARMDALFVRDKYEPRPLIWKAKILLDAGKLDDAEAAAHQAVTIDPSDGEHGPGRRMLVYSVLADILQARGDKTGAENNRGAVTAIRHSEDADRFYQAGLITRAITMYNEALTHFADAYCIQSRLALRMAELGDMEGAEKHYRRAYELMPDSFGRVESHCFGCEGAFSGYRAQNIAEAVFTDLAKKRPDKPQVHYLLGYLREAQGNYRGALPELREAVKLDPEYLNAWKKIDAISNEVLLPAAERQALQLNFLRLDPLSRHSSVELEQIIDLAAGWNAVEAAQKLRPPAPGPLYPLKASAGAAATAPQPFPGYVFGINTAEVGYGSDEYNPSALTPVNVVLQNRFIQSVVEVYSSEAYLYTQQQ